MNGRNVHLATWFYIHHCSADDNFLPCIERHSPFVRLSHDDPGETLTLSDHIGGDEQGSSAGVLQPSFHFGSGEFSATPSGRGCARNSHPWHDLAWKYHIACPPGNTNR